MSRFLQAKQTYSSGFDLFCSTPSSHSEWTYLQTTFGTFTHNEQKQLKTPQWRLYLSIKFQTKNKTTTPKF